MTSQVPDKASILGAVALTPTKFRFVSTAVGVPLAWQLTMGYPLAPGYLLLTDYLASWLISSLFIFGAALLSAGHHSSRLRACCLLAALLWMLSSRLRVSKQSHASRLPQCKPVQMSSILSTFYPLQFSLCFCSALWCFFFSGNMIDRRLLWGSFGSGYLGRGVQ